MKAVLTLSAILSLPLIYFYVRRLVADIGFVPQMTILKYLSDEKNVVTASIRYARERHQLGESQWTKKGQDSQKKFLLSIVKHGILTVNNPDKLLLPLPAPYHQSLSMKLVQVLLVLFPFFTSSLM